MRRTLTAQSGMSVMEILIAGLILITISGGLGSIALNQRAAETKASALSSQHALIVTLLQKVNTREVLLASVPESSPLGSCIRGENCQNLAGRRTPISFRKGQEIFSGNEGAAGRLFTPAGAPCGQTFGTPTAACPLSVTSAVTVRCVGSCTRPQYVYAHFNIDYCEPGRPCNQQNIRRLSTDQYAGSLLGIENVLVADCTPLDRENHPDVVDQGRGSQRRRSITKYDTSFLFGFNEAFSEDFPSLNDRDYDTYCRKLRVTTNSCDPEGGGVAIGFTRDARLICTERTGWSGTPPALPPVVVIPTPAPTPTPGPVATATAGPGRCTIAGGVGLSGVSININGGPAVRWTVQIIGNEDPGVMRRYRPKTKTWTHIIPATGNRTLFSSRLDFRDLCTGGTTWNIQATADNGTRCSLNQRLPCSRTSFR